MIRNILSTTDSLNNIIITFSLTVFAFGFNADGRQYIQQSGAEIPRLNTALFIVNGCKSKAYDNSHLIVTYKRPHWITLKHRK